jgi:hypothetical protein
LVLGSGSIFLNTATISACTAQEVGPAAGGRAEPAAGVNRRTNVNVCGRIRTLLLEETYQRVANAPAHLKRRRGLVPCEAVMPPRSGAAAASAAHSTAKDLTPRYM